MSIFRLGDQRPPEPQRINDTVVMRFEHVYEIDPALMELTGQQELPAWDTRRIVDARWDHLDWMHEHFADEVLLAGEGSETMPEGEDAEPEPHAMPSEEEAGPRPVPGSLEDPPT
jgi:hypothetical protein